jgi:uncharacterized protein (TIGR03086 family)
VAQYRELMHTDSEVPAGPDLMAAAAAEAARVVGGVPGHAMDAVTPCADWDLRALVNHTILWTAYSAERRAHGESVAEDLMSKDFTAEPGFAEDYAAQIGRAVTAWSDPAAWERELGVMGSSTPAADVAAMLIMEMVLHGWDVARATGQEYDCDDAVAALVLTTVEAQGELFRQYQGFAAIVPAPDTQDGRDHATVLDRTLRLSGRDPEWRPR